MVQLLCGPHHHTAPNHPPTHCVCCVLTCRTMETSTQSRGDAPCVGLLWAAPASNCRPLCINNHHHTPCNMISAYILECNNVQSLIVLLLPETDAAMRRRCVLSVWLSADCGISQPSQLVLSALSKPSHVNIPVWRSSRACMRRVLGSLSSTTYTYTP